MSWIWEQTEVAEAVVWWGWVILNEVCPIESPFPLMSTKWDGKNKKKEREKERKIPNIGHPI